MPAEATGPVVLFRKHGQEPAFDPDLVVINIKARIATILCGSLVCLRQMSPLFVVSRDVGYSAFRRAKTACGECFGCLDLSEFSLRMFNCSGPEAIQLCNEVCCCSHLRAEAETV